MTDRLLRTDTPRNSSWPRAHGSSKRPNTLLQTCLLAKIGPCGHAADHTFSLPIRSTPSSIAPSGELTPRCFECRGTARMGHVMGQAIKSRVSSRSSGGDATLVDIALVAMIVLERLHEGFGVFLRHVSFGFDDLMQGAIDIFCHARSIAAYIEECPLLEP